ncbi:MAG: JAB domain-containing protein [Endomicrobiales bacterium]|nr:JAB domain-containing protein [Endomicrobiales bacterium]
MKNCYKKYFVRVQLVRESRAKIERIMNIKDAVLIVGKYLKKCDREHLVVAHLDAKNNLVGIEEVAIGGSTECPAYPNEIFKGALLSNACSIIVFHNHTTGDVYPSLNDEAATKKLKAAGDILGIEVTDHIIVGTNGTFYSFQERRRINEEEVSWGWL